MNTPGGREWAVAVVNPDPDPDGPALVVADPDPRRSRERADQLAERAALIDITVERSDNGRQVEMSAVWPLVYRDTIKQGWILAAVGWDFDDVKAATQYEGMTR